MTTTDHTVTVTWDTFGPSYEFRCTAPADALCRVVWACDCETYYDTRIEDGTPLHTPEGGYDDGNAEDSTPHEGTFGTDCHLAPWFTEEDAPLAGSARLAVTPVWDGDLHGYEFAVTGVRQ